MCAPEGDENLPSVNLRGGAETMKTCQYVLTPLVAALLFLLGTDHVVAQLTRTDSQIAYYQQLIKRNPRNGRAFYGLGDALIRKARETGDPNYFNQAEEALMISLKIEPQNAGANSI